MLIEKENFNHEYKWVNYEIFKNYLNLVINKDNIPENECNKIIKIIEEDLKDNYIDIEEDNINDSETLKEENIEECGKDSDESIYDNKIEKNMNNDIESFVKFFNQLNIEKTNNDNNLPHIDKIEESYINKELLNPLRVRVQKKIIKNKSLVNDEKVEKKPILCPKHDYKRKKDYSYSKSKSKRIKSLVNDDMVEKKPFYIQRKPIKGKGITQILKVKVKVFLKRKKKGWLGKKYK